MGLDASITSTGICIMNMRPDYTVQDVFFIGFTSTKKWIHDVGSNVTIKPLPADYKEHPYHYRGQIIHDMVHEMIGDIDFFAIEDYAFGAKGKIFDIAEYCGSIKDVYYRKNIPHKKYPPMTVKTVATSDGGADKMLMCQAFFKTKIASTLDSYFMELPEYESPQADLVDAFWMAETARLELCYRETGKFPADLNSKLDSITTAIVTGKKSSKTAPAIEHPIISFGEYSRLKKPKPEKKVNKAQKKLTGILKIKQIIESQTKTQDPW